MQIPILSGITADSNGDWQIAHPRNMVPVVKGTGISEGYLRPADGITQVTPTDSEVRGMIVRPGFFGDSTLYVVDGTVVRWYNQSGGSGVYGGVALDTFGGNVPVKMAIGPDRVAIWTGEALYYSVDPLGGVVKVTDADLGDVFDGCWIDGYYMSTDGQYLIVTDINNPLSVNPLKYGSAEANPDSIMGVDTLSGEVYAFGRYTIEVFENAGGSGFPFRRIPGAMVPKGMIQRKCYAKVGSTFGFVGGGEGEAPGVYLMGAGTATRISTEEIDKRIWASVDGNNYPVCRVESRTGGDVEQLIVHLLNESWCYDFIASQSSGERVWHRLDSSNDTTTAPYSIRNPVFFKGRWYASRFGAQGVGYMTRDSVRQWDNDVTWEFSTPVSYNEARGAVFHELELVALPGRHLYAADRVITTAYSHDGTTFSPETPCSSGSPGETQQRIVWRRCGRLKQSRIQRFRGNAAGAVSIARLEARIEPLNG